MAGLCARCGKDMPDGANFCPVCSAASLPPVRTDEEYPAARAEKKGRTGISIAVVCGVLAAVIVVAAVAVVMIVNIFSARGDSSPPPDQPPPLSGQDAATPDDLPDRQTSGPADPQDIGDDNQPPDDGQPADTDVSDAFNKDWYFEVSVLHVHEGDDIPWEYEGWAEEMLDSTTMYTAKHVVIGPTEGQAYFYFAYTEVFAPVLMKYTLDGNVLEYTLFSADHGVSMNIKGVVTRREDGSFEFAGSYSLSYKDVDLSAEGTATGHSLDEPLF